MMQFIKKYYWYFIIFFFVFFVVNVLSCFNNYGDPLLNYGFSSAIVNGEVPYKDFNMVTTPLFPFYNSIFLLIWNNFSMFLFGISVLITVGIVLLYKIYGKNVILLLPFTVIVQYANIAGTYNLFCFILINLIIYLEKNKKNDYLIGFVIGLVILSKQTVGIFLIIPSIIFYYKDIKKLLKRFIGLCVPCLIFIIYLLVNGTFSSFIDLCFLGLFDFGSDNGVAGGYIEWGQLVIIIISFIISVIITLKSKNIKNYYLILCILFVVPIVDFAHFSVYFSSFLLILIPYIKIDSKYIFVFSIVSSIIILIFTSIFWYNVGLVFSKSFNHFEYSLVGSNAYKKEIKEYKYLNSYKDKNFVLLSFCSMRYDLINNNDIDYFDLLNNGNFGYNGTEKMIEKIKSSSKNYFIVDMDDYNLTTESSQFAKDVATYVIDNYKLVDSKYGYNVYYKE